MSTRKRQVLNQGNYNAISKAISLEYGIETAVLYAHLVDKEQYFFEHNMLLEDGSFYNIAFDIELDTGLSKYQQGKAIKKLKSIGLIDTVNKGIPAKRHFTLLDDGSIIERITNDYVEKKKQRIAEHRKEMQKKRQEHAMLRIDERPSKSIESTEVKKLDNKDKSNLNQPNNKSTNNKKNKRGRNEIPTVVSSFSFNEFVKRTERVEPSVKEYIEYFIRVYREVMDKPHPRLTNEQWLSVTESLFEIEDHNGHVIEDVGFEMKYMIDNYFQTHFDNCDYCILHFNSGAIKAIRYYEVNGLYT